uniref:Very-long-chain (3R)-3-hydroxyacyl-CoA dehydratase n=3 Tax=Rhizophora mucronata TaxID=61149 RepID=A0A2P2KLJ8_RHIMU
MSALTKLYLFAYNSLQAIGWATAFLIISNNFISTKSLNEAYASAGELICQSVPSFPLISFKSPFFGLVVYIGFLVKIVYSIGFSVLFFMEGLLQIIGFLEVIHGALGIVPTGVLLPFMQWGGRTHFVLAIVRKITEVQKLPSVFITFVAWSLAEVIRYPHYALLCIGRCPSWLTYLRYTAFIMLYPVGLVPGEMWLMYEALPFVKKKNLYSDFFAAFPFSYYDFLEVVLVCYPFLCFQLYLHLLKQRQSKLGRHRGKKNA